MENLLQFSRAVTTSQKVYGSGNPDGTRAGDVVGLDCVKLLRSAGLKLCRVTDRRERSAVPCRPLHTPRPAGSQLPLPERDTSNKTTLGFCKMEIQFIPSKTCIIIIKFWHFCSHLLYRQLFAKTHRHASNKLNFSFWESLPFNCMCPRQGILNLFKTVRPISPEAPRVVPLSPWIYQLQVPHIPPPREREREGKSQALNSFRLFTL